MEHKTEEIADVITIVAEPGEPGALIFATRREWRELPEMCLGELLQHETTMIIPGKGCVYFLLRNNYPPEHFAERIGSYKLLSVSVGQDAQQHFAVMSLTTAEAAQLMKSRLTMIDDTGKGV